MKTLRDLFNYIEFQVWLVRDGWKEVYWVLVRHGWLMQGCETPSIVKMYKEFFWLYINRGVNR